MVQPMYEARLSRGPDRGALLGAHAQRTLEERPASCARPAARHTGRPSALLGDAIRQVGARALRGAHRSRPNGPTSRRRKRNENSEPRTSPACCPGSSTRHYGAMMRASRSSVSALRTPRRSAPARAPSATGSPDIGPPPRASGGEGCGPPSGRTAAWAPRSPPPSGLSRTSTLRRVRLPELRLNNHHAQRNER